MTENNSLPPAVVDNHRRLLELLKTRVPDEKTAETILRAAYTRAQGEEAELKETQKMSAWFSQVLKTALAHHGITNMDKKVGVAVDQVIIELLRSLKPENADLINRVEIVGKTIADIAHRARTSPADITLRLRRARASLKKKILQTCGACATHGTMDCACWKPAAV